MTTYRKFLWFGLAIAAAVFACSVSQLCAADMQKPAAPKAVLLKSPTAPAAPPAFFAYVDGGMGWSRVQNALTAPGLDVQGTNKAWPTGALLGGGFGVQAPTSAIGFLAAQIDVHYDFTRASVGCDTAVNAVTGCAGYAKNSWRIAEEVQWSPFATPAQMIGKLPTQAQPAHWVVPIVTMDSWTSQLMILPTVGVVEKSIDLCATNQIATLAGQNSTLCDTRWLMGVDFGVDFRVPLSAVADLKIGYRYDAFTSSINSKASPVFGGSTFKASGENVVTVGGIYHFNLF